MNDKSLVYAFIKISTDRMEKQTYEVSDLVIFTISPDKRSFWTQSMRFHLECSCNS